ncbi:MAG TPA: glutamine synthetase family protein [Acidimicrobiales bacterium]
MERRGLLTVEELRAAVERGEVDTVLIACTDMQGRLQGKRVHARFFLDDVLAHGTEACNYLLAVDVDMATVDGYAMSSWELGYGDFALVPDLDTLRTIPWHDGTALVLSDVAWNGGVPVAPSPRQVLRRQLDRLAERGWTAMVGTELEFIVVTDTYEDAWSKGYRDLTPANQYNADYSILATSRVEPLLRRIRNSMDGAAMVVESAKGECNLGQHEITFRYDEALVTCDNHALYKTGAKEIAAQEHMAITFMAKLDEREGSSCHIHLSLRDGDGAPVMAAHDGMARVMEQFIAGNLATTRELGVFLAPNVNSYKRYQPGTFAPTALRWGRDNRTCAVRVVGHGESLRMEHRVPGADVNPYLAVAALIAAGLHGIEQELPLEPPCDSNAYLADGPHVPTTLREALDLWRCSAIARHAFGDDVVDHYANMARVELAAFDAAVTDWERYRGFERL